MLRHVIVDISTAAIDAAAAYIGTVEAPSNWKDDVKIAAYVAEKTAERVASAGLDLDLARLTGVGLIDGATPPVVYLCRTEDDERLALEHVGRLARDPDVRFVSYNGHGFDLPVLMRRAKYLGIRFPKLNLDRYRSPHRDLLAELSDRDPSRRRSLNFYVQRLGWTDLVKPLSGPDEARVMETGQWPLLEQSILHDLEATRRLLAWWEA